MKEKLSHYGGQALIEGILMRGKYFITAAFRLPNGSIETRYEKVIRSKNNTLWNFPFFRGLKVLLDSLTIGTKYLSISANLQNGDDDQKLNPIFVSSTVLISLVLSITLFFVLPALIAELFNTFIKINTWFFTSIESVIRLLIFIFYLIMIGKVNEIQRVFAYHGAEHKTINAYENNAEMDIDKVASFSTAHQRCGTSFLLTLILVSVLLFSLLGPLTFIQRIVLRIILIPVIAGISYEIIRWISQHDNILLIKIISKPNLALQKLTTREPNKDMLEVALSAFNKLLELERIHSKN